MKCCIRQCGTVKDRPKLHCGTDQCSSLVSTQVGTTESNPEIKTAIPSTRQMLRLEPQFTALNHAWNELRLQCRLPLAILATSASHLPSRNFGTIRPFIKDVPSRRFNHSNSSHSPARWVAPHVKDDFKVHPDSLTATLDAHRDANRASLIQTHTPNNTDNRTSWSAPEHNSQIIWNDGRRLKPDKWKESVGGMHSDRKAATKHILEDYEGQSQAPRDEWQIPSSEDLGYAKRPWLAHLDVSERRADSVLEYLTAEILAFEKYMEATATEKVAVGKALTDLRKTITSMDADIQLSVIGSRGTGLAMPLSDIDINIQHSNLIDSRRKHHIPQAREERKAQVQAVDLLRLVRHRLKKRGGPNRIFYHSKFIDAKIPIVEARHTATKIEIQIQSRTDGLSSMEYVKTYMNEFPTLRPLFFVLRQVLKMRGLGESRTHGIGSYSLIVMIVATLKFSGERYLRTDAANQLLYFLDFYSTIDFNTSGIAVDPPELFTKTHKNGLAQTSDSGGQSYPAEPTTSEANDKAIADNLSGRRKIGVIDPIRPFLMCLQDPANEDNDLGHNALTIKHVQATFANLRQRLKISMDNYKRRSSTSASTSLLLPCLAGNYTKFELKRIALQKAGGETVGQPRMIRRLSAL